MKIAKIIRWTAHLDAVVFGFMVCFGPTSCKLGACELECIALWTVVLVYQFETMKK